MIESIDPSLRVGLGRISPKRPDVVRLAEIVPGDDLDEVKSIAVGDDVLPAAGIEMRVGVVDELVGLLVAVVCVM